MAELPGYCGGGWLVLLPIAALTRPTGRPLVYVPPGEGTDELLPFDIARPWALPRRGIWPPVGSAGVAWPLELALPRWSKSCTLEAMRRPYGVWRMVGRIG